ncbi:uncharacterized protein LOC121268286 [Juglans microcarpa x Juglans regia]|uniref:uncharacterized protein LOC121268286 n=1 Tax=Juglans microcarpa x Juglans regia TaxID=2249226 RepID=UPI001B7E4E56|nr:uncharacterized protein LOC121268286 [Juglans microcarpa x Juglans regia]
MASRDKKPSKPSSSIAGGIRTLSDLTATRMALSDSDNNSDGPDQQYYTGGEKSSICSCTTCCKAQGRLAEEIVALSKLKYTLLEELRAQEKELFRLKVENMEYDWKRKGNKIRQEDERLRLEVEKLEFARREANERVERDRLERDERIMMIDVSKLRGLQQNYFEQRQMEIFRKFL